MRRRTRGELAVKGGLATRLSHNNKNKDNKDNKQMCYKVSGAAL
jgi:hypothetical protein